MFAPLDGQPVIGRSLAAFQGATCVDEIVVVTRAATLDAVRGVAANMSKVRAIVRGGERRQDSVQAGLNAVSDAVDFVAVHDAARPLITPGEIERVFAAAQRDGAAVLAAPVTDTLKTADPARFISGSIDRAHVFAMQTPQVFPRRLLTEALANISRKSLHITDEVSAVELLGGKVAIVPAQDQNIKITFPGDLPLAEFILRSRERERTAPRLA